jgi:GNAT superfamily N-acetyltransferase
MLRVDKIDTNDKASVRRFVSILYRLYENHPQWVPPILMEAETQLNKSKHPFYEHSDADFFIATRDGRDVGRIAALENKRFNQYHKTKQAQFYLFDCEDDQEVANALFERVIDWAKGRGLDRLVGPKGFGALDGYGIQVEGFEHRQIMSMMNYNYPYYVRLVENLGFTKEVDFVSCYMNKDTFHLPERVYRIVDRVKSRNNLDVHRFETKKDLRAWAKKIGTLYNDSFINNWEYYPLTDREIQYLLENILTIADPRLIKIITHNDDAIGFLFGFPDLSAAFQRAKGHLFPFGAIDILLLEPKRTKWVSLNGAGVLPEYQGVGGNALLYIEMEKTLHDFNFEHADLTQVAETAVQMRHDLENVGGKAYKNHRVYQKQI